MRNSIRLLGFLILLVISSRGLNNPLAGQSEDAVWQLQKSGVTASLRGLCVVDSKTVWASGSGGTVIKTIDGGETWQDVSVPNAKELDFRDLHAFDSETAVLLTAGQPARVYRTHNGGLTWKVQFEHPNEMSFFDALSFFDNRHGIAMSDPVDQRILLIETLDGGETWQELPAKRRPLKERGEAGFAASGTNMRVQGNSVYIALGGAEKDQSEKTSRIVVSHDRAHTWAAVSVPMPRNASSGIFSMVLVDPQNAFVVGGDYLNQGQRSGVAACSQDGGKTWAIPKGELPRGYRSGVAAGRQDNQPILIAVGPEGTDVSLDSGQNWQAVSEQGFHAIQFTTDGQNGWASGANGVLGRWKGKH